MRTNLDLHDFITGMASILPDSHSSSYVLAHAHKSAIGHTLQAAMLRRRSALRISGQLTSFALSLLAVVGAAYFVMAGQNWQAIGCAFSALLPTLVAKLVLRLGGQPHPQREGHSSKGLAGSYSRG